MVSRKFSHQNMKPAKKGSKNCFVGNFPSSRNTKTILPMSSKVSSNFLPVSLTALSACSTITWKVISQIIFKAMQLFSLMNIHTN